ncbi:MAG: alpha/beta hydrolase, partial [Planctomycetota bacterium]
LTGFFARHDEPGVRPLTHVSDLVPARDRGLLTPALRGLWSLPWWAVLLGFALLARWSPTTAIVLGGLGKATLSLDFGLTALAVTLGRLSARAPDGLKRPAARVLQRLLWPTPLLLISTLGWVAIEFAFEDARVGPLTLVAATVFAVLLVLGVRRLTRLWSRRPIAFGAVLVALVASHIVALAVPDRAWLMPADAVRATTEIPLGPTADLTRARSARLSYLAWPTAGPSERPPVVLLHGSPGLATDWSNLGPLLEAQGRDVYALDLPGFGLSEAWLHDYSARTYAEIVLAWMDARGIRRAHLVGWSNSGNLVIHAADLAPERLASITMLAATGPQETEGSGVRAFEHAKYLVGYLGVVALPEVVPPLQNAFPRAWRHAFIRNFIDTDQRLAGPIMRRIETPTLVLQGRADFLLADWAAEQHHEVLPASRLVVTADGHMMPFLNPGNVAAALAPFLERHDPPGVAALTHTSDLAPRPDRGVLDQLLRAVRDAPWWIPIPVLFVLAWLRPETTTAIAAVFTSAMSLDFGVAFCGLLPARLLRARRPWEPAGRTRLEDLAWTPIALLIAQPLSAVGPVYDAAGLLGVVAQIAAVTPIALLIAQPLSAVGPVYDAAGLLGVVAQVAAVTLALHLARRAVTREGRQRIRAGFVR